MNIREQQKLDDVLEILEQTPGMTVMQMSHVYTSPQLALYELMQLGRAYVITFKNENKWYPASFPLKRHPICALITRTVGALKR